MKFENLSEEDKEIFLNKPYKSVSELFGEDIPNWYYYDFYVEGNQKKEIFITDLNMVHKLPVRSHAYIFRWKMPSTPCIYSSEEVYSEEDLKSFIFRYTVGGRPLDVDEKYIKQIARGEIDVDKDFLINLNEQMDKTFTFKAWKIPFVHVTVDEYNFVGAWSVYEGPELIKIEKLEKKLVAEQENKKLEILSNAKDTIVKFPEYLSIIRKTVKGDISIEEAIELSKSKEIIVKGI